MDLRFTYDRIAEDWHRDHLNDTWSVGATEIFAGHFKRGDEILDVGCASGIKAKHLTDAGLRVTGIDISEAFIEIAKRECPKGHFFVLDMREATSLEKRFDGVFALASLLHIPKKEIPFVLKTLKSVLKPGGYLYIAVKETRPGQADEQIIQENDYGYEYARFFSFFTQDELERMLRAIGMDVSGVSIVQAGRTNWIQIIAQKPRIVIGGWYQHYKGGTYRVLHVATHTESNEEFVVYESETDGKVWVRLLEEFLEDLPVDGRDVPRFLSVD